MSVAIRDTLFVCFPLAKIEGAKAAPTAVSPITFKNFYKYIKEKNTKQFIFLIFSICVYFISICSL